MKVSRRKCCAFKKCCLYYEVIYIDFKFLSDVFPHPAADARLCSRHVSCLVSRPETFQFTLSQPIKFCFKFVALFATFSFALLDRIICSNGLPSFLCLYIISFNCINFYFRNENVRISHVSVLSAKKVRE